MSIRDIKRRARRDLHEQAAVPALYIVEGVADVPCFVRIHNKRTDQGDLAGTSFRYAERNEQQDSIVFWREQVATPSRSAIVSVETGEAYRIDHSEEPDDQTITSPAIRMSAQESAGLPIPDNAGSPTTSQVEPAGFYSRDQEYSFISLNWTGDPIEVLAGETFDIPLSEFVPIVDERKGEFADADLLTGDSFQPYAIDTMYFLQCNLQTSTGSLDNIASLEIDIGGSFGRILIASQAIPRIPGRVSQQTSIFTRVYAKNTFVENGGVLSLTFAQDTTIDALSFVFSE